MRYPAPFLGALLPFILVACRPPQAAWVSPADAAALCRDPAGRVDFREGFRNGAEMVRRAQKRGERPFIPTLDAAPVPPPRGALPPGARVEPPAPALEVDPATGLQIAPAMGPSLAFAEGQAEGFRWAWAQAPAAPPPAPGRPETWVPWPAAAPVLHLADTSGTAALMHQGDTLLWTLKASGFPSRHRWRAFPWGRPRMAALCRGVLWVAAAGKALALDPESGAIRALAEAPPMVQDEAQGDPVEAWLKAQREDPQALADREALRRRAKAGELPAMFALALELKDLDADADREALDWLRRAAAAGHGPALMELGAWHYQGRQLPVDHAEARRCFERARAAGEAEAEAVLAGLFPKGGE